MSEKKGLHGLYTVIIYMALLILFFLIPFLDLIVFFLLPLPFVIYTYAYGLRPSLVAGGLVLLLATFLASGLGMWFAALTVSIGIVSAHVYKARKGAFAPLFSVMITYIVYIAAGVLFAETVLNIRLLDTLALWWEESMVNAEAWLPANNEDMVAMWREMTDDMSAWFLNVLPGMVMLFALFAGGLQHIINRTILGRFGFDVQPLPSFRTWNLPKSVLFYYVIALLFMLFMSEDATGSLVMMITSLHLVLGMLMVVQGLTFIAHVAYEKNWGVWVLILSCFLSLLPFFSFVIRLMGILDIGIGLKNRFGHHP